MDAEGTVRFWDLGEGRLLVQFESFGEIERIALSADGRILATVAKDGVVRLWDLSRDRVAFARTALMDEAGRRLFVARADNSVEVRDLATNGEVRRLEGLGSTVTALAFDAKKEILFGASLDGAVQGWRVESGDRYRRIGDLEDPVTALVHVPVADRLITGTLGGAIQSWDWTRRRKAVLKRPEKRPVPIAWLAAADGAGLVFAADRSGKIYGWNPRSGAAVSEPVEVGAVVTMLAASPGGKRVAIATDEGRLIVWTPGPESAMVRTQLPKGTPLGMACEDTGAVSGRNLDGTPWEWSGRPGADVRIRAKRIATGGVTPPWVMRDPLRRLIEAEIASGLMLEEFRVRHVPADVYDARPTRIVAWSRD